MDNRTITHSLSSLSGLIKDTQVQYPTDALESTIESLLEKNTELTKELEKARIKISCLRKRRSLLLDIIVKVHKTDDEDDLDVDIYSSDINSEVETTDDEEDMEVEPVRRDLIDPITESPNKRRRTAQPKRQRANKPIEIPKDEAGNYVFPVQVGRTLLLALGTIVPNESFYNQNYIFPVGYSIQRSYKSMVKEDEFTNYTCSIDKDEFDKPIFCIQAEDAPDIVIKKNTPTAAWSEVLRRSNELRRKEFKNTVSGPEYYGLSSATIKKMIQELPGADECIGYQWVDL